jgi:hypothetical protein
MGIVAFNTGRGYTEKGQRIACKVFEGHIYFADIDRGIYGRISCDLEGLHSAQSLQNRVMHWYDKGMYVDACNGDLITELRNAAAQAPLIGR